MNTWTHPTNSRIALGLPVGTFSSNKPEFFELGTFRTNRKVARRCIAREHTTQQSVNILIRDTYIWVGFHSQCLFSLTPFLRLKKRQIHIRRIHFTLPSFGRWSDTASTRLGQLRRDWLVIKRAPFWILTLLECDAHLHKFIIELVFLNVFSKTCCEGLYHWWQHELC